ncbi:MAG TPA: hypothetical protein VI548_10840 [Chitinophagaceae bacterium]|nr:hypothetical protein [Chitinophagaceae bacterium]
MKKIIILLTISVFSLSGFSQDPGRKKSRADTRREERRQKINELIRQDEEGVLIYSKQSIFGLQLRTNGYGLFFEKGKTKSQSITNLYDIEFNEIKHPKEDKLPNGTGGFSFGNPYVYGKLNNFYQLQLGFGQQRILGQKGNKNGVALSVIYKGGLSLGLLRPYYIDVLDNNRVNKSIKYTPQDSALFVSGFIVGGSGLGKGWNELEYKPGAFVKTALRFDFGRFNEVVSGVEIGLSADFYSSKIPQMLFQKEKQFFYQGHIAVMFGHRK